MANYPASQPGSQRHTLSVLVENRPGVLARIAGLLPAVRSTSTRCPSPPPSVRTSLASR